MISKGSCVTEDWSNDWWNFSFAIDYQLHFKYKTDFCWQTQSYSQAETNLLALCVCLSAGYAHLYRYIKTIYIKDTQRTADINKHKVKVKKSQFFSLSLQCSFTAFVYRLHPPFRSFKSVASLESSNTSMWHSKGPYKRCLCVRHKNVLSNHFHSERRGCERKRGQKKED